MTGKILIVDDEEQLRKLFTRIIPLEGFKVAGAGSLKASKEILSNQEIDKLVNHMDEIQKILLKISQ